MTKFIINTTIIASILILAPSIFARTIRIGVIDNGYQVKNSPEIKLCNDVKNPINLTSFPMSYYADHGQNVIHTINKYAGKNADICFVIIKAIPSAYIHLAIIFAIKANVDIINLSYGGEYYNPIEGFIIASALQRQIIIVAAAGNEDTDLDKTCNFYPACSDKRILVVGNGHNNDNKNTKTNYGETVVDIWENGDNVTNGGVTMSGSSQAAAIATGKMVKMLNCKYNN